jgi:uncharacterized membrane protein
MEKQDFWSGFALGAVAGMAGLWASGLIGRGSSSRIIRLEKTMQIGRPIDEVFDAWSDHTRLPQLSNMIRKVTRAGTREHWEVQIEGQPFEWDAEVTQFIPNEAIGWKSVEGLKHSGRISFGRLGDDTLVHVQMNYAPPSRFLRPLFSPMSGRIEGYIERALREFKASLEGKGSPEQVESRGPASERMTGQATGTYGPAPDTVSPNTNAKFGSPQVPVEYTRPPEAKS